MSGRAGKSGHQNLIGMSSKKLLNEVIGDEWLSVTLVRENPMDVKTKTEVKGERFGSYNIAMADLRMYADVACAVVYDPKAKFYGASKEPIPAEAEKHVFKGDWAKYHKAIRDFYGIVIYIIECEINPRSGLLRDGSRLTAYKLIKQQNNNLMLILAVFEGTKVDNPGIFDEVWEFPRKSSVHGRNTQ